MSAAVDENVLIEVLNEFNINNAAIKPFGSGLINHTWKVNSPAGNFILQRINEKVFKKPEDIAHNVRAIGKYLAAEYPEYYFIRPISSGSGDDIVFNNDGWFRVMPFAEGSNSFDVAETPHQAYEAAKQFGRFTKQLSAFDVNELKITVPDFHNLPLRYEQFIRAVKSGDQYRISNAKSLIDELLNKKRIVEEYLYLIRNPQFKCRVTHHDTKISNVLFDTNGNGLCVIDTDTMMPGYFISDVGDMMRTYLSPASEEEVDLERIIIRKEFYDAVIEGYKSEMNKELTSFENELFLFAGKFSVYMQAIRFLTDYLSNDVYYGAKYESHNLMRATNQATLLQRLEEITDRTV